MYILQCIYLLQLSNRAVCYSYNKQYSMVPKAVVLESITQRGYVGRAVPCTICQLVSTNNYLGLFFLVYLSSQFLQFLCKVLHNLSAYIVPICQLVSSKSLNFVFRTTSLVNAPFREMFCKHFKTHINRGERQKLKTLLFQNHFFISKKSLIQEQSFDVMFQEVKGVAAL